MICSVILLWGSLCVSVPLGTTHIEVDNAGLGSLTILQTPAWRFKNIGTDVVPPRVDPQHLKDACSGQTCVKYDVTCTSSLSCRYRAGSLIFTLEANDEAAMVSARHNLAIIPDARDPLHNVSLDQMQESVGKN